MDKAATEIPTEAIRNYFERQVRLLVEGGVPLARVAEALQSATARIAPATEARANATALAIPPRAGPTRSAPSDIPADIPADSSSGRRFAEVVEHLQHQARHAPNVLSTRLC